MKPRVLLVSTLGLATLFTACAGSSEEEVAAPLAATPTPTPQTLERPTSTSTPTPKPREPDEPEGIPNDVQEVEIRRIVDGDTLELAAAASDAALASTSQVDVRLLEIDTPETKHPSKPVQCYGKRATRALQRLLPEGSQAWVQRDEELRDQYGRYLLYVWNDDEVFVNLRMVQRGFARAVLYEPNDRHWDRVSAAERKAKDANRGLWGACSSFGAPAKQPKPPPEEPERDQGGNCSPNYSGCVPPYPPDLDCSDVDGPIRVKGDDPHGFDRDGDGSACEA